MPDTMRPVTPEKFEQDYHLVESVLGKRLIDVLPSLDVRNLTGDLREKPITEVLALHAKALKLPEGSPDLEESVFDFTVVVPTAIDASGKELGHKAMEIRTYEDIKTVCGLINRAAYVGGRFRFFENDISAF